MKPAVSALLLAAVAGQAARPPIVGVAHIAFYVFVPSYAPPAAPQAERS